MIMPTYNFYNTKTEERTVEYYDSYADVEKFIEENPHINWLPGTPGQVDPFRIGRQKPDAGFRDLLKTIKRGNPGSDFETF
jgi:hypothetical protein